MHLEHGPVVPAPEPPLAAPRLHPLVRNASPQGVLPSEEVVVVALRANSRARGHAVITTAVVTAAALPEAVQEQATVGCRTTAREARRLALTGAKWMTPSRLFSLSMKLISPLRRPWGVPRITLLITYEGKCSSMQPLSRGNSMRRKPEGIVVREFHLNDT